jgi:spore coat polysaccharide biosynthesis protein SpsF
VLRAIIQARMSSRRFPGKVLAPLAGKPLLDHLVDRVKRAIPPDRIVIATSADPSDDPLETHLSDLGLSVFRGSLEDVFGRFQGCLRQFPCDWFFRICADSPLYDDRLLMLLESRVGPGVDLVTNVFPRSFPRGHSVELLRAETFGRLDPAGLTAEEKEHVTKYYYNHPDRFRIVNVESGKPELSGVNYCVDTPEDLARLEALLAAEER